MSNYRYHLGDQKHKIKTKQGKVKNVKKVDYRGSYTAMKSFSQSQQKPFQGLDSIQQNDPLSSRKEPPKISDNTEFKEI